MATLPTAPTGFGITNVNSELASHSRTQNNSLRYLLTTYTPGGSNDSLRDFAGVNLDAPPWKNSSSGLSPQFGQLT